MENKKQKQKNLGIEILEALATVEQMIYVRSGQLKSTQNFTMKLNI